MLLANAMRWAEMSGDPDRVNDWFAGRQFGRWSMQYPRPAAQRKDPAKVLAELTALRDDGIIDDAELTTLRARLRV
jgi:hypothetical protein